MPDYEYKLFHLDKKQIQDNFSDQPEWAFLGFWMCLRHKKIAVNNRGLKFWMQIWKQSNMHCTKQQASDIAQICT